MSKQKIILAGIVNESKTEIERLSVKIIRITKDNNRFIKFFPSSGHRVNRLFLSKSGGHFDSHTAGLMGISFAAYPYCNYIEFYSSIKSFPLKKGNRISLIFEDGHTLELDINFDMQDAGYLKYNKCLINDRDLKFMAEHKLSHWEIQDTLGKANLVADFEPNNYNKQYGSKNIGQILLEDMVKEILLLKPLLKTG